MFASSTSKKPFGAPPWRPDSERLHWAWWRDGYRKRATATFPVRVFRRFLERRFHCAKLPIAEASASILPALTTGPVSSNGLFGARAALDAAVSAATVLSAEGWMARIHGAGTRGPAEQFLSAIYAQVRARNAEEDSAYTIEAPTRPLNEDAAVAARGLSHHLRNL